MERFRALFAVAILCLVAIGVYVFLNREELGLTLPSLQELERRANVAAGQLGDKSVPKWRDFLEKSRKFAEENPDTLEIWLLRGTAALVVGDQEAGKEAGEHIVILNKSADPTSTKLIKVLWAKRWVPTSRLNQSDVFAIINDLLKGDASPLGQYYQIFPNSVFVDFMGTGGSLPSLRFRLPQILEIKGDDGSAPPYYLWIIGDDVRNISGESRWGHGEIRIALKHREATQLAAELLTHLKDLAKEE